MPLHTMPRDELSLILECVPSDDWLCVALTCMTLCVVCTERADTLRTLQLRSMNRTFDGFFRSGGSLYSGMPTRWVTAAASSLSRFQWAVSAMNFVPRSAHKKISTYGVPTSLCGAAAIRGDIDLLCSLRYKYCLEWTLDICAQAAAAGQIATLQWLRAQDPPCPWIDAEEIDADAEYEGEFDSSASNACNAAASNGQLVTLQWLRSQEPPCPCDWLILERYAAEGGHLATLQWIRAQNESQQWDELTCWSAASGGHDAIIQWLRSQQPMCPWGEIENPCTEAARHGHLSTIQLLRALGCPWDEGTCSTVAFEGDLLMLQWLRAQTPPCPVDSRCITDAAKTGQLAIIKWLRAQNPPCPWQEEACEVAAVCQQFDTLRWMRTQDPPCPYDRRKCFYAVVKDILPYGTHITFDSAWVNFDGRLTAESVGEWTEALSFSSPPKQKLTYLLDQLEASLGD